MGGVKIIRVWGRADNFDIELSEKGGRWVCTVPPDIADGQYAVELHAVNLFGETAYWTGTLYMCNGVCHLEIKEVPYVIMFSKNTDRLFFLEQSHEILIRKGCEHYARTH